MQALGARMSLTRPCAQPLRANRQCSRLASGSSRPLVAARVFGGKGDPEKQVSAPGEPWQGSPALLLLLLPPPPPPLVPPPPAATKLFLHQRSVALQPDSCLRTIY